MEYFLVFCMADDGVTSIEYAMIALLIAIVIVGAVTAIGVSLTTFFQDVNSAFP